MALRRERENTFVFILTRWVFFSCLGFVLIFWPMSSLFYIPFVVVVFLFCFVLAFCDMHHVIFVFVFCDLESIQPIVLILRHFQDCKTFP